MTKSTSCFFENTFTPFRRSLIVDADSFTGSAEVGGYFLKYASESNLKPVALEMGGKSPIYSFRGC